MHSTETEQRAEWGDVIPDGWYGIYQGTWWSPETGYPDKHASAEILAANSDKARGGTGKSMVNWRESRTYGGGWVSDSHFVKVLPDDHEALYIEFWIRFSENWFQRDKIPGVTPQEEIGGWISKIFRVGHWNRVNALWNSSAGGVNPRVFWDYGLTHLGARNIVQLRQGPPGSNPTIKNPLKENFTSGVEGQGPGGTDPLIPDQLNPGSYIKDLSSLPAHENIYGTSEHWTKMAFYVKSNSAPGAEDGVIKQWINDVRIMNLTNIPWTASNASELCLWNYFAIGGNDYFNPFDESELFEDWYSIDDVLVSTEIPEGLE